MPLGVSSTPDTLTWPLSYLEKWLCMNFWICFQIMRATSCWYTPILNCKRNRHGLRIWFVLWIHQVHWCHRHSFTKINPSYGYPGCGSPFWTTLALRLSTMASGQQHFQQTEVEAKQATPQWRITDLHKSTHSKCLGSYRSHHHTREITKVSLCF